MDFSLLWPEESSSVTLYPVTTSLHGMSMVKTHRYVPVHSSIVHRKTARVHLNTVTVTLRSFRLICFDGDDFSDQTSSNQFRYLTLFQFIFNPIQLIATLMTKIQLDDYHSKMILIN